jgi:hypothetical protein
MTTPAEQASERLTSKHADLLNVLDAMAGNMHYAVRRQELRQAEQLIVEQEEALDAALKRAERAEARLAECEREWCHHNKEMAEEITRLRAALESRNA